MEYREYDTRSAPGSNGTSGSLPFILKTLKAPEKCKGNREEAELLAHSMINEWLELHRPTAAASLLLSQPHEEAGRALLARPEWQGNDAARSRGLRSVVEPPNLVRVIDAAANYLNGGSYLLCSRQAIPGRHSLLQRGAISQNALSIVYGRGPRAST